MTHCCSCSTSDFDIWASQGTAACRTAETGFVDVEVLRLGLVDVEVLKLELVDVEVPRLGLVDVEVLRLGLVVPMVLGSTSAVAELP